MELGLEALAVSGFALCPAALPSSALQALEDALRHPGAFSRRPAPLGPLQVVLKDTFLPDLVAGILGPGARPIRAFYLDKNPAENWAIAWHQDTTLAFAEALEVPGFTAWTNKAHFFQAQAPDDLMARILSTRIHLDEAGECQGGLQVLPGTHRLGRLGQGALEDCAARSPAVTIAAPKGSVLLMHPLLVHGSQPAPAPSSRRVLHAEWAAFDPPDGLRWAWF